MRLVMFEYSYPRHWWNFENKWSGVEIGVLSASCRFLIVSKTTVWADQGSSSPGWLPMHVRTHDYVCWCWLVFISRGQADVQRWWTWSTGLIQSSCCPASARRWLLVTHTLKVRGRVLPLTWAGSPLSARQPGWRPDWCIRARITWTRPRGRRRVCWTLSRVLSRPLASRTDTRPAHNTSLPHSSPLQHSVHTPALCMHTVGRRLYDRLSVCLSVCQSVANVDV